MLLFLSSLCACYTLFGFYFFDRIYLWERKIGRMMMGYLAMKTDPATTELINSDINELKIAASGINSILGNQLINSDINGGTLFTSRCA